MKKSIAMILVLAGCMALAGCAENEEIEVTEGSVVTESDGAGETESSESSAGEQIPAGGYMRYTYTIDDATGERTLSKVEEYDGDGHLISDMNYSSIGDYGVTNVYVNGILTEEWYTNTDGETYLSSRVESAVFGENERISISYHYDHEDYIGYTEYSYDEQGEHRVCVSDYDTNGTLTEYDEYVYDEFEKDYHIASRFNDDYETPIRICWGEEPEEELDEDCSKCTYKCDAPCCKKNEVEEKTEIDTDDDGKVNGFTKSWKDKNSFFIYSYHSANEKNVLDLMEKFKIGQH